MVVRDNSICEMENLKIRNNYTENWGGGICCRSYSLVMINNCEISSNEVTFHSYTRGGAICCLDSSKAVITNSTLVDNVSDKGGGVYCDDNSTMTMINSICRNSSLYEIYTDQELGFDNPVTVAYTNILGGAGGIGFSNGGNCNWLDGNTDSEPLFIDPEQGDYRLLENSPCVDNGTDWFEWNEEVLIDLAGDEYYGEAPDMGCYEYGLVNTDELKIENVKCKINAYPNPFNPETTIGFYIAQESFVELAVYNVKGQKVAMLMNGICEQGKQQIVWQGRDDNGRLAGSGMYFIRLDVDGEGSYITKSVLMK